MNKKFILLILLSISVLAVEPSATQELSAGGEGAPGRDDFRKMSLETLMEGHYLPDFSFAGYRNGLAPLPETTGTVISVRDFGATASDSIDDTKAVQAAIKAANETPGRVTIRFDKGRYRISGILKVERSDISLQGMGSGLDGTTLHFPRPLNHIDQSTSLDELREYIRTLNKRQVERDKNINEFFSEYSWSGGFIWIQKPGTRPAAYLEDRDPEPERLTDIVRGQRGGASIEVADPTSIKRGDIIQIQWINSDGPEAGILRSLYRDHYQLAGAHHWSFPKRPLVRQTARVLRVEGNTVTLSDVLLHNIDTGIPAQLAPWDGLVNVGVEDLHIEFPPAPHFGHHLEQGYNGIYFTSAFDSWVRDVRITNADNGILSYSSANLTYANVVTDGRRLAHYAVHLGNVHNVLVEDVRVMNPVRHSLTFNTQATKCVYKNAEVFITPTLDQHAGSNHQNLYDQVTLHVPARRSEEGPVAPVYDGSGAGYWQPGHGAYNTSWNLKILITGGAYPDETVTIQGLDEGPAARNIGLHGNRSFELDYRPAPFVRMLNEEVQFARSLYDYQLSQRLLNTSRPN
ncbi:MAG: glycosyl hydrolase family 28-related protein [Pseudomonadota bacterium]